jgi:hypothetical protein
MKQRCFSLQSFWICLGILLTLWFGVSGNIGHVTTLATLFPDLADVSETTTLSIGVGWLGLSTLSPISSDYSLELHKDQFEGEGRFKAATVSATRAIIIPCDVVRAFLAAAVKVELVERNYQPRITHTDDYPFLSISVLTRRTIDHWDQFAASTAEIRDQCGSDPVGNWLSGQYVRGYGGRSG